MKRLLAVFLVFAGLSLSVLEAVHRHDADLSDQHCETCCVSQNAVVAPATEAPRAVRVESSVCVAAASPALSRDAAAPARAARGPPLSRS